MSTSRDDIREWFKRGKKQKATHLIVVCDTYDYEDYPKYIYEGQDAKEVVNDCNAQSMQKVMEVYNLSMNMEEQIIQHRSFNY